MLVLTFLYAAALLVLGVMGVAAAPVPGEIPALATPALFFGGAVLLCALFALREPRHGLAAASFLAFLATLAACGKLIGWAARGQWAAAGPGLELTMALLALSVLHLAAALLAWRRSRARPPSG